MTKSKAKEALRTIGEAAEMLNIPVHVIRFWETKFSNIKPVKYNNRRYYSSKSIEILEQIRELLYKQNYSIKEAVLHLKKKAPGPVDVPLIESIFIKKTEKTSNNSDNLSTVKDRLINAKNKLNALLSK